MLVHLKITWLQLMLVFPDFSTIKMTYIFFLYVRRPQDSTTLVSLASGSLSGVASSTGNLVFQFQASCLNFFT
jgi:hypothetical protein